MLQSQQTLFFLFAILCSDSKIVSQSLQEDKIMAQITSDMLVGQIVNEYPMLIDTLLEAGMHCLGCPSSQMESLEDACMVHGLNPDALVLALNSKLGEVEA
jgi:hydrid cluster protein-associated redox disulfide domain